MIRVRVSNITSCHASGGIQCNHHSNAGALERKRERYQNDCCASLANEDHVQGRRVSFGTNCYRTVSGQSAVRQPQTVSSSKGGSVYSSQRLIHEFNGEIR